MKAILVLVQTAVLLTPLRAHHSFAAEFDASKPITLKGTVTRVDWTNPHVFLNIDVADRRGKVTNWRVESLAPNGLQREGWMKSSVKPGDTVTLECYPAKDQENLAKTAAATLPDGRRVLTGYADEHGASGRSR